MKKYFKKSLILFLLVTILTYAEEKKKTKKNTEGVIATFFEWAHINGNDEYYFTIKNNTNNDISSIKIHVLFYDKDNNLIDSHTFEYEKIIPAGLAKKIAHEENNDTVTKIENGTNTLHHGSLGLQNKTKRYEIRIADFNIVN